VLVSNQIGLIFASKVGAYPIEAPKVGTVPSPANIRRGCKGTNTNSFGLFGNEAGNKFPNIDTRWF